MPCILLTMQTDNYHLMGCMLSAASCNKWWMDEILKTKDYAAEQEAITKLGENHVFYLPYLMGERSPHNDPYARGSIYRNVYGYHTGGYDTGSAGRRGIWTPGFPGSGKKSWESRSRRTKICGGGAKSPLWRKIIANVMNMKVDMIESEEGPGYGAAMLAAVGCGEFESVEEAARACESNRNRRTGSGTGAEIRGKISEIQKTLSGIERNLSGETSIIELQ